MREVITSDVSGSVTPCGSHSLWVPGTADASSSRDPWPDKLMPEAFHGVAGEIVRIIEPHSEADPAALLIQMLVAFGNVIGRQSHFRAEADKHFGNLFTTLVGVTSKGRKGSSWGQVHRVMNTVDANWCTQNVSHGLASGEGLMWGVRDTITKKEPIRAGANGKSGRIVDYQDVIVDEGVADKRLLILESEFASVLQVCARDKNTLSAVMRQAWDVGDLHSLTKNSPARATNAHISIVGHITRDELRRLITATDMANGLANRILWICVQRSKALPDGGNLSDADFCPLAARLSQAVEFARSVDEIYRDDQARKIWHQVYPELSAGKPGLLGAATSRAESQTMRLAMLYALLDQSSVIREEHLQAALAVWKYAEQSARYVFGSAMGDPVADDILRELRRVCPKGLSRKEIRDLFSRHQQGERIAEALDLLQDGNLVRCESVATGGRPAEHWYARV